MNIHPLPAETIQPELTHTLDNLFQARVAATPQAIAYQEYDAASQSWQQSSWAEMAHQINRWRSALQAEDLQAGERVAIMLGNCRAWVCFEQAALSLGLVVVPLYVNDRPENIAFILQDAGVQVLLCNGPQHWQQLEPIHSQLEGLRRIVTLAPCPSPRQRVSWVGDWLPAAGGATSAVSHGPDALATIVYTSGTTGRPKGVMLSHANILANTYAGMHSIPVLASDLFLSFLPLSHMLERTVGHYIPMAAGSTVAYARSVQTLAEDLLTVRPTMLISVPRIYERIYGKITNQLSEKGGLANKLFKLATQVGWQRYQRGQGRGAWSAAELAWPVLKHLIADKVMEKLGGRLRVAICGGAPIAPEIARTFIGLGLNLMQGYGLTEASPVISVNRLESNMPEGVGPALPGIEVSIGEQDELLTRGPCVMLGYWHNPEATSAVIDQDGWLHTGDQAVIENRHIRITGRLKEILVLSNGEKVPPADMELAITLDPVFEQCMVVGDGHPFLTLVAVINPEQWAHVAAPLGLSPDDLQHRAVETAALARIANALRSFPGYAQIRRVHLTTTPWTVEDGQLTPTLKLRRKVIMAQYQQAIDQLYLGH